MSPTTPPHAHTFISPYTFAAHHSTLPSCLPQWPLAHVSGSPPPSETPFVPQTIRLPQNANDTLSPCIQTKWHDILQLRVWAPRERQRGVGEERWSSWGGRWRKDSPSSRIYLWSCTDKDQDIVCILYGFIFPPCFYCSPAILLFLTSFPSRQATGCCCNSFFLLLITASMCLFYLATDSL